MERKSITGEKMGKEEKGRELMRMIGRIRVTLCCKRWLLFYTTEMSWSLRHCETDEFVMRA